MSESTEDKAREILRLAATATPGQVVTFCPASNLPYYHLETLPGDVDNSTIADFYRNKAEADFAAAANPEAITEILSEFLRMKKEEAEEEAHERKWEAFCRESDVRCVYCDLRYGERQQYSCIEPGHAHYYDDAELTTARIGEKP